ncbi:hypothetical protein PanWU01x14_108730, partial [Parasponia andersonii]
YHKPYKKDAKKWKVKKKKHGNHHFELRPRGVLGSSCLKFFLGKLKVRWSRPFKETNRSPYGANNVVNESPTKRITVSDEGVN